MPDSRLGRGHPPTQPVHSAAQAHRSRAWRPPHLDGGGHAHARGGAHRPTGIERLIARAQAWFSGGRSRPLAHPDTTRRRTRRLAIPDSPAALTVAGLVLIATIASVPAVSGAASASTALRSGPRLTVGGDILDDGPAPASSVLLGLDPATGPSTGAASLGDGTPFRPVAVDSSTGIGEITVPATPRPTSKPAVHVRAKPASPSIPFAPLAWPVPGGYISQGFGCTGFIFEPPYGSCPHFHSGIDIAAPSGTPILAAATGTVVFAGWSSNGGGLQVWIRHPNGLYTGYHHMSSIAVHVGQVVLRRQRIGRVGMTGNATGPHCHFMVATGLPSAGGTPLNPMRYL